MFTRRWKEINVYNIWQQVIFHFIFYYFQVHQKRNFNNRSNLVRNIIKENLWEFILNKFTSEYIDFLSFFLRIFTSFF